MNVYLVTLDDGNNSGVQRIFSTRENAEKYVAACKSSEGCWYRADFNEIDELEIDGALHEQEYQEYKFGR